MSLSVFIIIKQHLLHYEPYCKNCPRKINQTTSFSVLIISVLLLQIKISKTKGYVQIHNLQNGKTILTLIWSQNQFNNKNVALKIHLPATTYCEHFCKYFIKYKFL